MKVYLELPVQSRGLQRVRDALVKYAPDAVKVVSEPQDADLTIIHVYGRHDRVERQIEGLKRSKRPYAMVQYAIRSTMNPSTFDWVDMWQGARLVWSYYYLPELCFKDGLYDAFPFYHSPLGVEDTFYDRSTSPGHKACVIATCSPHALAEGVRECVIAAQRVGRRVFHLGHDLRRGSTVFSKTNITDDALAYYYSCCEFVSGLRRIEGFELPAAEGLLCGARPILYDKPHYRSWFDEFAVFISERPREFVIDDLERIFRRGAKPVSDEEKTLAKTRFNWSIIIDRFWRQVL